jgi:hypothetical protein
VVSVASGAPIICLSAGQTLCDGLNQAPHM